jgi:hypothetical protein
MTLGAYGPWNTPEACSSRVIKRKFKDNRYDAPGFALFERNVSIHDTWRLWTLEHP